MRVLSFYRAGIRLAVAVVALTAPAVSAPPEVLEPVETTETFKVRGKNIIVDVIAPRGDGRYPRSSRYTAWAGPAKTGNRARTTSLGGCRDRGT